MSRIKNRGQSSPSGIWSSLKVPGYKLVGKKRRMHPRKNKYRIMLMFKKRGMQIQNNVHVQPQNASIHKIFKIKGVRSGLSIRIRRRGARGFTTCTLKIRPHRKRVSLKFCSYSILDPNFAREEWSHVHKSLQTGRYDTLTENLNEL